MLKTFDRFPGLTRKVHWGYTLPDDVEEATIALGFAASLACNFRGFEVLPREEGVTIALSRSDTPYKFEGDRWTETAALTYQTPDELRSRIPEWAGPVTFHLHVIASDPPPLIREVNITYDGMVSPDGFVWQFALPERLKMLVSIPTIATSKDEVLSFTSQLNSDRVFSVKIGSPSGFFDGIRDGKVWTCPNFPNGVGRAIVQYDLPVEFAEGPHQVSHLPVALVRMGETTRLMEPWGNVRVATDGDTAVHRARRTYNRLYEISAIARETDIALAIAKQLIAELGNNPVLNITPTGKQMAIYLSESVYLVGVREDSMLPTAQFKCSIGQFEEERL